MLDDKTEALIHEVIDGEAADSVHAELEKALAADPATRASLAEYRALSDTLAKVPDLEVPSSLHRALRGRPPEPPQGPLISLLSALAGAKALRYAYSFSAGVLVTVIALQLGETPTIDGEYMTGTMAPMAAGQRLSLTHSDVGIRTHFEDGLVQIDLTVDARQPVEIDAVFGVEQARVAGFSSEAGPTPTLEVRPGRLTATVSGSQRYRLTMEPTSAAPTMILTLRAPDGAATQQVILLSEHR
jgi:hypothetical protein